LNTGIWGLLLVGSLYWCGKVARRWREDLELVRHPKKDFDRGAVLVIWGLTLIPLVLLSLALWAIVERTLR